MSIMDDILLTDSTFIAGTMPGDETAIYTRGRTGGTVSVSINVNRKGPQPIEGLAGAFTEPETVIFLYAGQGITSVDTGGDTLSISRSFGGTAEPQPISEAVTDDAGGWLLRI